MPFKRNNLTFLVQPLDRMIYLYIQPNNTLRHGTILLVDSLIIITVTDNQVKHI